MYGRSTPLTLKARVEEAVLLVVRQRGGRRDRAQQHVPVLEPLAHAARIAARRSSRRSHVAMRAERVGGRRRPCSARPRRRSSAKNSPSCSAGSTGGRTASTLAPASASASAVSPSSVAVPGVDRAGRPRRTTPPTRAPVERRRPSTPAASSRHASARSASGRRGRSSRRSRSSALRAIGPNTLMSASVVPPVDVVEVAALRTRRRSSA